MTFFNNFIYVSVLLLILMLVYFIQKFNKIRENFKDVFHITDANKFNYDKISINPDNSYVNDPKKGDEGMYFNEISVNSLNKLYVGNSAVTETSFTLFDLYKILNRKFPYIKKTSEGERLHFNNIPEIYYLDADNLRALQGKQNIPLYNSFFGPNKYALKIEAQRDSFETSGLKCGVPSNSKYSQKPISGIVPFDKEY